MLIADSIKCYRCGKSSHFKNKCLNQASVNKVSKEPLEQEGDNVEEEEDSIEETDENLKGNREAQGKTPSQAYISVIY